MSLIGLASFPLSILTDGARLTFGEIIFCLAGAKLPVKRQASYRRGFLLLWMIPGFEIEGANVNLDQFTVNYTCLSS